jgi:hypothetical protein
MKVLIFESGLVKDLHYSVGSKLLKMGKCELVEPIKEAEELKIDENLGTPKVETKKGRPKKHE